MLIQKEIKAVYLWENKVRPPFKPRTFTISRTEQSNMSSWWTYSDDAAWLTAGDSAFDEFFWYYGCRLNTSWQETATITQEQSWWAWKLDITRLWTLTSWDNVMIAFPVRWIKMTKSWSTVTLSITDAPNADWYQYYAFTKWSNIKDVMYLWAYIMNSNYKSLSWATPKASATRDAFRSWVASTYNDQWRHSLITYRVMDYIKMLYMMKYWNPDSQTVIWYWYTSWYAATTWTTNSITNATWATATSYTWRIKLFWLEDIWGNMNEWLDCCYFDSSKKLTVDNTNSIFQDAAYSTNLWVSSSWYMRTIDWSTEWTFRNTSSSAASSSTYYHAISLSYANRVIYSGGHSNNAGYLWMLALLQTSASNSDVNIGSRLLYL